MNGTASDQLTGALTPPNDLAELSEWIDALIQGFADHPDEEVRQRVFALLNGIDALHRAALGRLVACLQGPGAQLAWAQARNDQLVQTVLLLYDLLPPAEKPPPKPMISLRQVGPAPPPRVPEWFDLARFDEVPSGTLRGVRVGDHAVMLCNVAGTILAYHDSCPDTPLALSLGHLDGDQIVCPWHGCRFNARTGERLEHRGTGLKSLPVAFEGNRIRVELDTASP